jgi:hypothetical protein
VNHAEAARGLSKLEPSYRDTGDRQFRIVCECGTYIAQTKMSRKRGTVQLGDRLESAMASQLGVGTPLWRDIAGCTKGLREFLTAHGHWHRT